MLIKFVARGEGSAAAAADYLLGERNAAGKDRAAVEVLRGDPHQVAAIADGLAFEHRYTSGVIAWSPEDNPTQAQIERVIDGFEKSAWAGLDPDRYAWSAILHRDHGSGVHVHIFAARCDLETGLSLNIAPPGWQKTFDPLRDAFNFENGWSRPDDPERARAYRPTPHRAYRDAATLRAGLQIEPDPREQITEYLAGRVVAGAVRDRDGVVAALQEAGFEVPRKGTSYVTVRDPDTGGRWRLRGELYDHDFNAETLGRSVEEANGGPEPAGRDDGAERAAKVWRAVEAARERRARYHQERSMAAQNANVLEEIRACGAAATTTVKEEERTLEATIAASTARTYRQLLRRWSVPVMVSLMLSLGIFSGSWGTMQWLSSRIQQQYKALSLLQLETERAESTLTRLRGATWGVTLHRDRQGRFVVLPSGTEISREWTVRARPAVRLGN